MPDETNITNATDLTTNPDETAETPSNSILVSVKEDLNVSEWDDAFDNNLIREINTAFMILSQLGVGPEIPFVITSSKETWDDFLEGDTSIEAVKSYIYKKVRLSFDTPTSSSVLEADKDRVAELEWRLNAAVDRKGM